MTFRIAILLLWFAIGTIARAADPAGKAAPGPAAPTGAASAWLHREFPTRSAWDIGGEWRVRYEAKQDAGVIPNRDFVRRLATSNDYFLLRATAHIGWSPNSWLTAKVQGRDSRVEGDAQSIIGRDAFDLYQAFIRVGDPAAGKSPFTVQVGRQELAYGDERHVGSSDWSNSGRSFDAVKVRLADREGWVDLFAGRPVIVRPRHLNLSNDYDTLSGVYASTRRLVRWQDSEFYFLARNVTAGSPTAITPTLGGPGPRDIYTFGSRWKSVAGQIGNWDYTIEAAGQNGSINQAAVRRAHRAFAFNAAAGRTWPHVFGTPRFGIGYDFGSGDAHPNDNRNETFELLFATNHRLYGNMDLAGLRNMHIPRVEFALKPRRGLTVSVEWLGFWLAETADLFYPESGAGRAQNGYGRHPGFRAYVGNEADFLVNWRLGPGALRLGYGHFFVGDYIRQSITSVPANGGAANAEWCFVQFALPF